MKKQLITLAILAGALSACGQNTAPSTTQQEAATEAEYLSLTLNEDTSQWWKNGIMYEIWPRSFYDSDGDGNGDFNGMTAKLDYLDDLGVNGVWLTPIFEAPSYHGYDFQEFYEVESDYGTMQELENFITEAHKRDIKIILDLVLNHISSNHEWFEKSAAKEPGYEDYFVWRKQRPAHWGVAWETTPNPERVWHWNEQRQEYYYGAFGATQPDLNLDHPVVVEKLKDIATFWLNKGVDGFRLDAVRVAKEQELPSGNQVIQADTQGTIDFWGDFTAHVTSINPDALMVGEAWADMQTIGKYWNDGKGLNGAFDFDFGYVVTDLLNDVERTADFGNVAEDDGSKGSAALWHNLTSRTEHAPLYFYAPFLTNHDQTRIAHSLGEDPAKIKVAASLLLTTPGPLYMYYGEEIGLSQHKVGDHVYRRAIMQWQQDDYAGFNDSGKIWVDDKQYFANYAGHEPWWQGYWMSQKTEGNMSVEAQQKDPDSIWSHYKRLIEIRHATSELQFPQEVRYFPVNNSNVWLVENRQGEASTLTLVNLNTEQTELFEVPATVANQYQDKLTGMDVTLQGQFRLQPGQTLIL